MILTVQDIAQMMDLSCVRTDSSKNDIEELVNNARHYNVGQVSVMHCFIPYVKHLLKDDPHIKLVGNVSFPSGSDSTSLKVMQAEEMVASGCDEIDMVINVGKLCSGDYFEVEEDVRAVVGAANQLPVKVIIEMFYLNLNETRTACEISINAGAAFVKTGTGWTPKGTTIEDVKLIKSMVGDRIKIKASGGIRDLDTLVEMYKLGTRRFGVNLASGKQILDDCLGRGGKIAL
jgi:deoxyribose-phosphate aldolase